ncbi:hypothetical protein BCT75_04340 [Vibrio lentus]|uniref:TrbC/VirB2 family protein n=1 Tax=Vibrio lentus TaxID=136468 RepID=UPI000C850E97|nr:TrbC/VirB2 family protein [Vibrio lentus]PML45618.1 hypothetical protein BCT75_04340 [Vibrio lentus]
MNNLKTRWLQACIFGSLLISSVANANDAADIFDPVNEKTKDFGDQLTLWASAVCLVCIVGVGLLAMFGKFPKQWAVNTAVGSTIILVGGNIANFLLN